MTERFAVVLYHHGPPILMGMGLRGQWGGGGAERCWHGQEAWGVGQGGRYPVIRDALDSCQCAKGCPEEYKPPEDTKIRVGTISGEEES